ncbi:bag family molecular chaperone regulator 1 [Phtheirospermum japonicum]|uniref:Bag family molecular chaperone regulator 1 n=1 Tax=Phtheirospermum japonicum TaxID=374723 RepID=A0A830CTU8_9LAMI|nr:bag family molecular chaperone regulator 1 [Phtheirospermum japonicum]
MNSKATGVSSPARGRGGSEAAGWEVRPGGMLVQQRTSDSNPNSNPVPNNQRELKKMLAGLTGLNTQDQKLIFKERERDSKAFLDISGVKDGSKIVLIEDELSRERRFVESRKNAKMDKASKRYHCYQGFKLTTLQKQVASIELEIKGGKKVVDTVLLNLIELLMTQLIKLDGIAADGDVKLQRRMQVKRVQKYIETLDMLKIRNSGLGKVPLHQQHQIFTSKTFQNQQEQRKQGSFNERDVDGIGMAFPSHLYINIGVKGMLKALRHV